MVKNNSLYKKNVALISKLKNKPIKKVFCDGCGGLVEWRSLKKVDVLFTRVCGRCVRKKQFR
jgi:uncharacterized protein YlaI